MQLKKHRRRGIAALLAATAAAASTGTTAFAATPMTADFWTAGSDNWAVPTDWSLGHSPTNTGGGEIGIVNNGGTVQVNADIGSVTAGALTLGASSNTDIGNLQVSGGTLNVGGMQVGGMGFSRIDAGGANTAGGQGSVVQSGGDVIINVVNATSTVDDQNLNVGYGQLGSGNTGTGTYTMTAGTLTVGTGTGNLIVIGNGLGAAGLFVQQGGAVESKGSVQLGRNNGIGTWTMSGGTLKTGQDLNIGGNTSGTDTFNLGGTGALTILHNFNVGIGSGVGTLSAGPTGILNMTSGTIALTAAGAIMTCGNGTNTLGQINQSGGTITETGATAVLDVGRAGAAGTYTLSGTGTLTEAKIVMNAAAASQGITPDRKFLLQGGTLSAGTVDFGTTATTAPRLLEIDSGTANIGAITIGNLTTNATVNITGGTVSIASLQLQPGIIFETSIDLDPHDPVTPANSMTVAIGGGTVQVDSGTLTFSGAATSTGALNKTGAGTLTITGPQTNGTGSAITVAAGTLNLNSDAATTGAANLIVNANSTTNFGANQHLAALNVGPSATATITASGTRSLVTGNLTIGANGRLDIQDNHLIVKNIAVGSATAGVYNGVSGTIQSGRASGNWSGSGIVTSQTSATNSILTSIGIATAQQVKGLASATETAVWAGQTVSGSDSLVMYTYGGDANLDGKIDISDYGRIDFNIPLGTNGWFNGDFNYDGKIDISDYGIIDFNIGIQGAQFFAASGSAATSGSALPEGVAAVPEPTSISLFALGAAATALGRRRRRLR